MEEKPILKKLVLVPGYQYNNRCVFYINSGKRALPQRTTAALRLDIKAATARDAGFTRITVATNGRMFSYRALAARCAAFICSKHKAYYRNHSPCLKLPFF